MNLTDKKEYSVKTTDYINKMIRFCETQGVNINLDEPRTIQDKLAWLNIYDVNPLKTFCADKITLHEYCKQKLGKDICIPIIKTYDSVNDINLDELPKNFVLKCNHGRGMSVVVKDKAKLDFEHAKEKLTWWLNDDFSFKNGFEAHYHDIERKVFAERYKKDTSGGLTKYNFICFNGKPSIIQIVYDNAGNEKHMNYYDMNFNLLSIARKDINSNPSFEHKEPENLSLMVSYAEKLSAEFKFVVVTFHEVKGNVLLGGMSFTPRSMAFKYENDEDNLKIGNMLNLLKVDVYCLCKNEMKLTPFMIDYWEALGDDVNVYVFDGLSTDGCREEFAKHNWIHIIDFEPDALDDNAHVILKNSCWKESRKRKTDFVMVCDFDETIFSYTKEKLYSELLKMKRDGYTFLAPLSFNLIPDVFPEYQKGKYLHELAEYGFNDYIWEAKPILFDPNKIIEFNVLHGGHAAHPTGDVRWYSSNSLFLIHAKFVGYDYYEDRINNRIVSKWNIEHGIDGETNKTVEMLHNEFETRKNKRFKWSDIPTHFTEYYRIRNDWSRWNGLVIRTRGDKRIIVSMTSWPKRIGNVKTVMETLLNQSLKPNLIELNLSTAEFPNKVNDLPKDLVKFIESNRCIDINWVERNDGVFKKIIPTLQKFYGEDYYLLSVDDDRLYRNDYIQRMVWGLEDANVDSFSLSQAPVIGNRQIYRSTAFGPDLWEKLTQEVIDCRIDDSYYEYYLKSKGKKLLHYIPDDISDLVKLYNDVYPNSSMTETGSYSYDVIAKSIAAIKSIDFSAKKENPSNKKVLIYTAMSGAYESPTDNFEHRDGYDYVLLSDEVLETVSWRCLKVTFNNAEGLSNIKKARFLKTHPHTLFKEDYDAVVYVDCNTSIDDKLYNYIDKYINNPITFKQHNDRNCVYQEIMACYFSKKEDPGMLLKLYDRYTREGYPRDNGLLETNVIILHHKDPQVIELLNIWWEEIFNFSHRDQLSLNYLIWRNHLSDFISSAKTFDFPPKVHQKMNYK